MSLDTIIPPEIAGELSDWLTDLAKRPEVHTILEVGASSGDGSTAALVNGMYQNPSKPKLCCLEVSKVRYDALVKRWGVESRMLMMRASSVPKAAFMDATEVENFYNNHQTNLNQYPLETVLGWLYQDLQYLQDTPTPQNGIDDLKKAAGVQFFDLAVLDGSAFTGMAELKRVYGSRYIVLDDVVCLKHFDSRRLLSADLGYNLLAENLNLRNGYSIFEKKA